METGIHAGYKQLNTINKHDNYLSDLPSTMDTLLGYISVIGFRDESSFNQPPQSNFEMF